MTMPFPGMDPYLEHPILWTGVHSGLAHAICQQFALALRPRYVASLETREVNDVPLDLQAALNRVYEDGSYMLRAHYERPCSPPLEEGDQQWAWEQWAEYKNQHRELFG